MVVVAAASADCVPSPDWVCSCVAMMVAAVVAALVVAAVAAALVVVVAGTLVMIDEVGMRWMYRSIGLYLRHYDESSECATARQHKVAEVACYRLERTLMGCADPPSKGCRGYHHQCSSSY